MTSKPAPQSGVASAKLSAVLSAIVTNSKRGRAPTLGEARAELQRGGVQWSGEGELLYPQDRTSLLIELDDLIGRFGAQAPVKSFIGSD